MPFFTQSIPHCLWLAPLAPTLEKQNVSTTSPVTVSARGVAASPKSKADARAAFAVFVVVIPPLLGLSSLEQFGRSLEIMRDVPYAVACMGSRPAAVAGFSAVASRAS